MKNKVQHLWSVMCASSVTDQETNVMSLLSLIDQLNIESFPQVAPVSEKSGLKKVEVSNIPINFEIVSFLQRQDSWKENSLIIDAEIEIFDPKGTSLNGGKFKINFPQNYKRLRYRTKINGINITVLGEYWISLKIDGGEGLKEVVRLPLDVRSGIKIP